jgi:hypothetical protein
LQIPISSHHQPLLDLDAYDYQGHIFDNFKSEHTVGVHPVVAGQSALSRANPCNWHPRKMGVARSLVAILRVQGAGMISVNPRLDKKCPAAGLCLLGPQLTGLSITHN